MSWLSDTFGGGTSSGGTDWLSLADEGLKLYGQYENGQNKSSLYQHQADYSKKNADYELQQAKDAYEVGSAAADKYGTRAQRYEGSQVAAQGASGIQVGSGTFQQVNQDTQQAFHDDMATMMRNTVRSAYGHQLAAEAGFTSSNDYRGAANNALLNSQLGMMGTVLTGDYADGLQKKFWE
jgi:hypothetical protein